MADESKSVGEGSPSASPASTQAGDRSQILAQATRFLTSANVSESASDDDKRDFLRSKGLNDDEISRAFQDAKSPVQGLGAPPSNVGDVDAFEIAARQFDDPINADSIAPPPRSYPNSPLALYYDPPAASAAAHADPLLQGTAASPLTRYQVLLQFFRTLSFMMMLGGGLTAVVVSAYRAYVLPKITAMFDARSIVLKHHIVLFDKLRSQVASLATYVPIQHARIGADDASAGVAASPLKGVLKKVHFHDDLDGSAKEGEKGGVKSTQHTEAKTGSEKIVMPGTDVVVDAKTPLLADDASEAAADAETDVSEAETEPKLEPIDVTASIRESMARLAEALRGELAGLSTTASASAASSGATSSARGARAASVADAGSGSDEWEDEEEEADGSDDDDGLEFDPYGAYQKKHKHTQSSSAPPTSGGASKSLAGLKSTLTSLNADISTHAFAATSSSYTGGAFRIGAGTGTESPKSGDLGQVKAEIRSLKGLLLSRRNFPSYGARPPPLPAATANMDARTSSAVV